LEVQSVDFSLHAKDQRNVVAAVVSTAGRRSSATALWWIGFSEDDTKRNRRGADIRRQSRSLDQRVEDNAFHLTFASMIRISYLSPKTEVRESKIHGRGLFATADIAKDEIVAVKGDTLLIEKLCGKRSRLGSARWKFRSTTICTSFRSPTKSASCRCCIRTTHATRTLVSVAKSRLSRCATFGLAKSLPTTGQ